MLGNLGTPELTVLALAALFLFGGKKIPEIMKGLGQVISEFKKGAKEE